MGRAVVVSSFLVVLLWEVATSSPPPFTPLWEIDGKGSIAAFLGSSSLPLGIYLSGSSIFGLSVKDGTTLWESNKTIVYNDTSYWPVLSGVYVVDGGGDSFALANYNLELDFGSYIFVWQGLYAWELKTGAMKGVLEVDPRRTSQAMALSLTGDVFMVEWDIKTPNGPINRLSQLKYPFDAPAVASLTWPSNGQYSSSPPLILLQKSKVVLQFFQYSKFNASLSRLDVTNSKNTGRIGIDWTVQLGYSAPASTPSQDETKLYLVIKEELTLPSKVLRLDVKTGNSDWVWTWGGANTALSVAGEVMEAKSGGRRFFCGAATYSNKELTEYYAYCADPQKDFTLALNISLGDHTNLKGVVFGVYQKWFLIRDIATGDLLGYNPFQEGINRNDPTPDWRLPGQSKLQRFIQPIGGGYAVASHYPATIIRWDEK